MTQHTMIQSKGILSKAIQNKTIQNKTIQNKTIQNRDSVDPEVIRTDGLERTFEIGQNQVRALRGVDLRVRRGEMVAIMGTSGSGKSTLMNILGCLDSSSGGTYSLDGIRVDQLDKDQLADVRNQKIGFIFQGFNLLARTSAIDNVALPLLYDRTGRQGDPNRLAVAALERVGLGDRVDHQPSELSGGQQQRVAIARALVTEPSLLLADEPTGNLDSRTTIEICKLFQELNELGLTIVLVTHEPEVAQYAERVVELRDGRVIRDELVAERRSASSDLERLDQGTKGHAA